MNKKILLILLLIFGLPLFALNVWMMRESKENPKNATTVASPTNVPIDTAVPVTIGNATKYVEYVAPTGQKTFKCNYKNCGVVEYTDPSSCGLFVCCELAGRWSVMSTFECQTAQNNQNSTNRTESNEEEKRSQKLNNDQACVDAVLRSQQCTSDCYKNADAAGSTNPDCAYVCSFAYDMQNSLCE